MKVTILQASHDIKKQQILFHAAYYKVLMIDRALSKYRTHPDSNKMDMGGSSLSAKMSFV
jgi:hypothetical protein